MGLHASSLKKQEEQNISALSTCLAATNVRRTLSVNAIQETPNEYRNVFHMNSLRKKIINSTKALGSGVSSKHKNNSRKNNLVEHARLLRDLTDTWNVLEIDKLVDGYRAALTLSELSKLADDARPYRASLSRDMFQLFKKSFCCDIHVKCDGVTFAAHKLLLAARSGYFKNLIDNRSTLSGSVILINSSSLNHKLFNVFLEYIYSGKVIDEGSMSGAQCLSGLINEIALEFGVRNSLESDLRQLYDSGLYNDALLILQTTDHRNTQMLSSDYCSRTQEYEFPCHIFILVSRSAFFLKYFSKQKADLKVCSKRPEPRRSHNTSMQCIEIDERVIPRRFLKFILHALYMDELDFTLILPKVHGSINSSSSSGTTTLSEVKAMMLGQMVARPVRQHIQFSPKIIDAMELYQIGRFLNFQQIVQGCEDMIVSECPVGSLPALLNWCSIDGQGSDWVRRRVMQMLYSRFGDLSSNDEFLGMLTKQHMIELVSSDYLQMSELDILLVIIRWGELQLLKWFIDSDSTVVRANARPTDSIVRTNSFVPLGRFSRHRRSRSIPKRRSISTPIDATSETSELSELISELLVYVRCGHILAPNVVESVGSKSERLRLQYRGLAIARKLGIFNSRETVESIDSLVWNLKKNLSLDFLHLSNRSCHWIPSESNQDSNFLRPRLFLPFYNQSRLILKERLERLKKNESSQSVPCVIGVISRYDTFNKITDKKQSKDIGSKTCKNAEHKSIELIVNNDLYDDSSEDLFECLKKQEVEILNNLSSLEIFQTLSPFEQNIARKYARIYLLHKNDLTVNCLDIIFNSEPVNISTNAVNLVNHFNTSQTKSYQIDMRYSTLNSCKSYCHVDTSNTNTLDTLHINAEEAGTCQQEPKWPSLSAKSSFKLLQSYRYISEIDNSEKSGKEISSKSGKVAGRFSRKSSAGKADAKGRQNSFSEICSAISKLNIQEKQACIYGTIPRRKIRRVPDVAQASLVPSPRISRSFDFWPEEGQGQKITEISRRQEMLDFISFGWLHKRTNSTAAKDERFEQSRTDFDLASIHRSNDFLDLIGCSTNFSDSRSQNYSDKF